MKPLSAIKYYLNNMKKFITIVSAIILSVALLYTVQMFVTSSAAINYRTFVEPQEYYSSIAAKSKVLDRNIIDRILSHGQYYEKVTPWVFSYTNFDSTIQGSVGCKVMTVKHEDMKLLMQRMNLAVKKGRLPEPGTNEIILHRLVADSKGLKVGDRIGSSVQKNEVLQGEKLIVGLLEGESIVSFDSLEYWMEQNNVHSNDYSLGMIILHGRDTAFEIERFLNSLDTAGLEVRTLSSVTQQYKKDMEGVNNILSLIGIIVIVIVAICTSFISYIYFLFRRSGFGILSAMGYSCQDIVNMIFREIALLNIVGLASGISVSVLAGLLMNYFIFIPKGQYLLLASPEYFFKVSCIPLFSIIFSIIPVWRMLKNLDPVTIIEGIG